VWEPMIGTERKAEIIGLTTMSVKRKAGQSDENVVQFPLSMAKIPRVSPQQPSGGVDFTNRKGKTYYLHVIKTKKGNPRYHFSVEPPTELVKEIPEGHEIYENPNAQVFLRKVLLKEIPDEELEVLERELTARAKSKKYRIDVKGKVLTVFWTNQRGGDMGEFASLFGMARLEEFCDRYAPFSPLLRFTLVDGQKRLFVAERFCFRGSIDDWMSLIDGGPDSFETLVKRYVRHLGKESFYELM
jgi:hypothetical protein